MALFTSFEGVIVHGDDSSDSVDYFWWLFLWRQPFCYNSSRKCLHDTGWTSRQQFEENWMNLLAVLNSPSSTGASLSFEVC